MAKTRFISLGVVFVLCGNVQALEPLDDAVFIRVVDVGAGLCCVIKMPGNHYMIYDAGNHEDMGHAAFKGIMELIPLGTPMHPEAIDLLILSHSDSDHLASVPLICAGYQVKTVFRSGWPKPRNTWRRANLAIARELEDDNCEDYNLAIYEFPTGEPTYPVERYIPFLSFKKRMDLGGCRTRRSQCRVTLFGTYKTSSINIQVSILWSATRLWLDFGDRPDRRRVTHQSTTRRAL